MKYLFCYFLFLSFNKLFGNIWYLSIKTWNLRITCKIFFKINYTLLTECYLRENDWTALVGRDSHSKHGHKLFDVLPIEKRGVKMLSGGTCPLCGDASSCIIFPVNAPDVLMARQTISAPVWICDPWNIWT